MNTKIFKLLTLCALFLLAGSTYGQGTNAPVTGNKGMLLRWDDPDPLESVIKWDVQVWKMEPAITALPPTMVRAVETTINAMELTGIFGTLENGNYFVVAIAVDVWGFASLPSEPFHIWWYARPRAPKELKITFNQIE